MPTYVYRREDGTQFDHFQRMKDDALTICPTTGQSVKRLIGAGAGILFKGTGFYETDYKTKSGSASESSSDSSAGSSSDSSAGSSSDSSAGSSSDSSAEK